MVIALKKLQKKIIWEINSSDNPLYTSLECLQYPQKISNVSRLARESIGSERTESEMRIFPEKVIDSIEKCIYK